MERKEPALISLLARLFIKPDPAREEPETRRAYGVLCGIVGICLNVLLFAGKFLAGTLSGSIAITADAFNNLSDAGSSFVTLVGFQLAGQKPDSEHPFGHGRMEYVSGLAVSVLILLMGLELGKTSIEKILHPEPVDSSPLIFAILCASILVKLYMFLYNRRLGKKLASPAMEATAMDSLSDSVATAAVLIATLVGRFTGLEIDGWCGVLVAAFILWSGINAVRDTLDPLLGTPPTHEFVQRIRDLVMAHSTILGIHDLIVHDYGPGRAMMSFHAEVPADARYSRQDMLDAIVSAQLPEGGFALGGSDMDVDITAMALQALAPYQAQYPEVIDAALNALSAAQTVTGGFESWGAQSSESCAQVILALTALDIDPVEDGRFQKNQRNVVVALMDFRLSDGGFAHEKDGPLDAMACEQAMQALTAMELRQQGEGRFFDLTAAHPVQLETTPDTDTETPAESGGSFPVLPVVLIVIAIAAVALVLVLKKKRENNV